MPEELRVLISQRPKATPSSSRKWSSQSRSQERSSTRATRPCRPDHIPRSSPDTVQDVIMARIDRLGEEPKRVLQLAAVIGREFTDRLLDRLAGTHDATDAAMRELKAKELIYEKSLFPEPAYLFKHALTQEVAYNSLLIKRRRDLHSLAGLAIEELYADRLDENTRSSPTISPGRALGESARIPAEGAIKESRSGCRRPAEEATRPRTQVPAHGIHSARSDCSSVSAIASQAEATNCCSWRDAWATAVGRCLGASALPGPGGGLRGRCASHRSIE